MKGRARVLVVVGILLLASGFTIGRWSVTTCGIAETGGGSAVAERAAAHDAESLLTPGVIR